VAVRLVAVDGRSLVDALVIQCAGAAAGGGGKIVVVSTEHGVRSRARRCGWLVTATVALIAPAARAQGQGPSPPELQPDPDYGEQTMAANGLALAAGLLVAYSDVWRSAEHDPPRLGVAVATTYFVGAVGAPAVHFARGRFKAGANDLLLRFSLPPMVSLLGMLAGLKDDQVGRGAMVGMAVGVGATWLIDAFALAEGEKGATAVARPPERWYGWQVAMLDGLGVAFGLALAATEPRTGITRDWGPLARAAAGFYTVGFFLPPLVHFVHGRPARALGAWAARGLIAPVTLLLGMGGYCAATGGARGCVGVGASAGFLAGMAAAAVFDIAGLAWEPQPSSAPGPASGHVVPAAYPVAGGAVVGALGSF